MNVHQPRCQGIAGALQRFWALLSAKPQQDEHLIPKGKLNRCLGPAGEEQGVIYPVSGEELFPGTMWDWAQTQFPLKCQTQMPPLLHPLMHCAIATNLRGVWLFRGKSRCSWNQNPPVWVQDKLNKRCFLPSQTVGWSLHLLPWRDGSLRTLVFPCDGKTRRVPYLL